LLTCFPGNVRIAQNTVLGPGVVVAEWSRRRAPWAGGPLAPTGKQIDVPGCSVYE